MTKLHLSTAKPVLTICQVSGEVLYLALYPSSRGEMDITTGFEPVIPRSNRGESTKKANMYYVYILRSLKDKRTYVGHTHDVKNRLTEHNRGNVKATAHRKPLEVIFVEECATTKKAKKRERYWKSGAGRRKLKKYFSEGFPPIQNF